MNWHTAAVKEMPHLSEVEGWLEYPTARITAFLLKYQTSRDLIGDVMEIGVFEGKYFLILAQQLRKYGGERAVAVDIFESQQPVLEGSAQGTRATFEANLKKYAPPCEVIIMESDSTRLTADAVRGRMMTSERQPFRFISIDGSHDALTVQSDLMLAEELLMPGGIVALDDWRPGGHLTWPGVMDGEIAYQSGGGTLMHIGTIPNKLLLTNDPFWMEDYRTVLRDYTEEESTE